MDQGKKKEKFSVAYVNALSAQAGFATAVPDVDDDSIDLVIKARGLTTPIKSPQIDVQLKCTATDNGLGDFLNYSLKIKNYDDLRVEHVIAPRYLLVLRVPANESDWLVCDSESTLLKHCCYWYSLRGMPDSPNVQSVSLPIPRAQFLDAQKLKVLLERAGSGESNG